MPRRQFGRELEIAAVHLFRGRGVSLARAARDLAAPENVLRKSVKECAADPARAFRGQGQTQPEQFEIERLRREVAKRKAERDNRKSGRGLPRQGSTMSFAVIAGSAARE